MKKLIFILSFIPCVAFGQHKFGLKVDLSGVYSKVQIDSINGLLNTDVIPQGSTNLYFTPTGAVAALTGQNISIFANDIPYATLDNLTDSINELRNEIDSLHGSKDTLFTDAILPVRHDLSTDRDTLLFRPNNTSEILYDTTTGQFSIGAIAQSKITGLVSALGGKISDTSAMHSEIAQNTTAIGTNTTNIALKVNTADTANMLSTYRYDYAQKVYAAIGSTIKAEPITGNISNISAGAGLSDGQPIFILVYLPKDSTITGVKWFQSTQGSYTANNYNGVALFSLSGGTLTLIDSSLNDGNIWKATASAFTTKAFPATHHLTKGVYCIGVMYCRSAETTAPGIGGFSTSLIAAVESGDFSNSVKLNSKLFSQTAFTASIAMSSTTATGTQPYVALY